MRNWFIAFSMLVLSACAGLQWPDLVDVRGTTVKISDSSGHGSGTVISKTQVLTAAHVVRLGDTVDVEYYDGTKIKATVTWVDDKSDTAILTTEGPTRYATIIDCKPLEIGDRVFTLGNPGIARFVLTEGVVASTETFGAQVATMPNGMPVEVQPMILISADWEPGDSGAGVFDMKGHLRAIVNGAFLVGRQDTNNGVATPVGVLPQCKGKAK